MDKIELELRIAQLRVEYDSYDDERARIDADQELAGELINDLEIQLNAMEGANG